MIIGRDGNLRRQEALRNLNSHLHRIEVLTFDQLPRIAGRGIGVLGDEEHHDQGDDDGDDAIPF